MTTVAEILRKKAENQVYTVSPDASVVEALRLMADKDIGGVLVTQDSAVIGIFTERDYARKIVLMERSSHQTAVREVMSSPVKYVRLHQSADDCMRLMTESRVRHLPVLENEKLLGVISIGDLVKNIISEQKFIIEQLEHYITGDHGA